MYCEFAYLLHAKKMLKFDQGIPSIEILRSIQNRFHIGYIYMCL